MDLNNSCHSSSHSADTDVLMKIPNNFFDPNFNFDKSHFSNDNDFMKELDNFLHSEQHQKDALNSTGNEQLSYKNFVDPLHSLEINKTDQDLNLQEEQLKRQHFEQLCGLLQKKILQYQQKVAFIVKVDKEKDQLIQKLKSNEGLDIENNRLKLKVSKLEQEVTETIHLINKFQTKNEMLELKIENLTSTSTEMREISKKQIHDLEVRMSNSAKTEIDLQEEIEKLKANCKAEKENFIKEKHARSLLDRDVCNLKAQVKQTREEKMRLHEKHDKDKQVIEQKQKKIFNGMMDEFADKERNLLKELDLQRMALKNYYQTQLESALEEKVGEFQEQLDSFQNEIKQEAVRRERHHNERTINQVEMIVRKNEEEIDLINRKCVEEVELYRIQLINATRTIETLEGKLGEFQVRRHDIAENLHSIMETQWKKTLEILTNPSKQRNFEGFRSNDISESDNNQQFTHENHQQMMNNLSKSEENLKSEMLRNYIDKLLKQSPKSDQVNDESNSQRTNGKGSRGAKTPWK